MKKILIVLMMICFMVIKVEAASSNATEGMDNFESLKSTYEKENANLTKYTVNGSEIITLYGMSDCNGSNCTVYYAGGKTTFEEVLKTIVTCSGGETNIMYQAAGSGKTGLYDVTKSQNGYSGKVYWSEEYQITCTSSSTGSNNVVIENVSNGGNEQNGGITDTPGTNVGTGDSTVENPETGVTTYFMVLGIIAVISYVGMIFIKKYNLFKNV